MYFRLTRRESLVFCELLAMSSLTVEPVLASSQTEKIKHIL